MAQNRSFLGVLTVVGLGAAAVIGTIAAYQHRKEIRDKANEWAAVTINRIKDLGDGDGADEKDECECGCACPADLDGDGVDDAVIVDVDGDGVADYAAVDTDGDGKTDVILADTTGDGVLDTAIDPEEFAEKEE